MLRRAEPVPALPGARKPARALAVMMMFAAQDASACGADTDCVFGTRSYRIHLPPDTEPRPIGALLFAHGWRGSADGTLRDIGLRRLADDLGVALIAVDSAGDDWAIANAPQDITGDESGELAYFDAVVADASARFAIDPGRIVASGFSAGGMMVWTLACRRGDRFAGFIAMSGTFWAPVPADCDSPAGSLVHIHGRDDTTVPLAGRPIGPARQGVVDQALAMYARHGGFGAARTTRTEDLECSLRDAPDTDRILAFCLFDGGHSFRLRDLRAAWDMLGAAGRP